MARFSLKELLLGTTYIAIGLFIIRLPWLIRFDELLELLLLIFLFLSGGTFIGAGILLPFKRLWLGAGIGFACAAVVFVVMVFFGISRL